ncbi:hypothetical protein AB0M20_02240 [Actinoplanes sp. NPDC051633]|uniref:hypothetical protein n=1 Tax=Actinoplanes sp. NPDC051633 TaxID=3155670 RepID=UPI00342C0C2B
MATEVALADLPSTSGAHWANRDVRRTGGETPFRRPPARRSLETEAPESSAVDNRDDAGWNAFLPAATATQPEASWESGSADQRPAEPGTSSRASFGVTDEPISGNWFGKDPSPVSPAGPAHAQGRPTMPMPGETPDQLRDQLPVRGADGFPAGGAGSAEWPTTSGEWPAASTEWPAAAPEWPAASAEWPATSTGDWSDTSFQERAFFDESAAHHEIRPHRADSNRADADQKGHHHQDQPRRSKLMVGATVALSSLVLLGATAAGVAYFAGDDSDIGSVLELGSADKGGTVATAPLGGRSAASFELVAATRRAVVKTQDLGGNLFKITAAGESGTAPKPAMTGDKVQLLLAADGEDARGNVEVLLSNKVTWALRFTGGGDEQVVDLTGGKVSALDLTGASRRVDLKLPTPSGTVPLRVTGAIEDLSLASPKGSPVRVKVDSGAKTVAAGTRTLQNVKPGSTLTPKDWKVPNRYDVDAEARLTLLTVRTVG